MPLTGHHTNLRPHSSQMTILIAEDDMDAQLLAKEALHESKFENEVHFVNDGEDLLDFLRQDGAYIEKASPRPDVILLDLNMPRKDGREALREIKEDPKLRTIPVVVMTSSKAEEDIAGTYSLGVNSFVVKPMHFADLVQVMTNIGRYWFETVELPPKPAPLC